MIEFKLPSLGADMDEGKLLEWMVKPGDLVKRGQAVAVVDTAKAAVDVEIWQDGTMFEQLVPIGATVPVGTVLATLLEPGESATTAPRRAAMPLPGGQAPAPAVAAGMAPAIGPAVAPPVAPTVTPTGAPIAAPPPGQRRPVSPAARARAQELGLDIDGVAGTGPHGAVTLADVVLAAAVRTAAPVARSAPIAAPAPSATAYSTPAPAVVSASTPAAPSAAPAPAMAPADRALEMRKAIGAAMSRSKREIPHYYLSETIPMARAAAWLARANEERPVTVRLLMGVLQLKAVAHALGQVPQLNGFWRDGGFQPGTGMHIGVAIALRQGGLIAPALLDVGNKDVDQLMRELTDLVRRARAGSLRSSEMSDPTITVTNLGEQGSEAVYGVIYPPQVALVGFGRMVIRPWIEDGQPCASPLVTASLAADHRASDGHSGARFLIELRERLQQPEDL